MTTTHTTVTTDNTFSAKQALSLIASKHGEICKASGLSRTLLTYALTSALLSDEELLIDPADKEGGVMSIRDAIEQWVSNRNRTEIGDALLYRWIGIPHVPPTIEHEVSEKSANGKIKTSKVREVNPAYSKGTLNNLKEAIREYAIPVAWVLYCNRDQVAGCNAPLIEASKTGASVKVHASLLPSDFKRLSGVMVAVNDALEAAQKGSVPYVALGRGTMNCSVSALAKVCKADKAFTSLYASGRAPKAKQVKVPDYSDNADAADEAGQNRGRVASYDIGSPATLGKKGATAKHAINAALILEDYLTTFEDVNAIDDSAVIEHLQDVFAMLAPLFTEKSEGKVARKMKAA
jgi:hypothetical protein